MKIYYMMLEPYPERYTELLTNWTISRFEKLGHSVEPVYGLKLPAAPEGISVGAVLDAYGRSHWGLTQVAELVRLLRDRPYEADLIYFDDLFTPGYEALPYILDQLPPASAHQPLIVARNHAQSVDPDDFTFPMRRWMRPFEQMVYSTANKIVCASTVHRELMAVAGFDTRIVEVIGLPYDREDVLSRAKPIHWQDRDKLVVYSSRLDTEKQPFFFAEVVERVTDKRPDIHFAILTGAKGLRSSQVGAVTKLQDLERRGLLAVHANLSKQAYYGYLAGARVQLNTARQDFISYTAIEASTFGVPTVAPAFRAFPECLRNRPTQLYVPWSVEDAADKVIRMVDEGDDPREIEALAYDQDKTLDRISALFNRIHRSY